MELVEAVRIAVARTGHQRYAHLLDPGHPDFNPAYEAVVRAIAEGHSPPAGPSMLEKARNFATATVQHVAAGMPRASAELATSRLATCRQCEQLRGDACKLCGCNMPLKVTWAEQKCPEGKW